MSLVVPPPDQASKQVILNEDSRDALDKKQDSDDAESGFMGAIVPAIEYGRKDKHDVEEENTKHFFGGYLDKIAALKKLTEEANAELAEIDSDEGEDVKQVISSSAISVQSQAAAKTRVASLPEKGS